MNNSLSSSERTKVTENYVDLFQVGNESVQVFTEELCVEFGRNRVVEYSARKISARSTSTKRTAGGKEVFLVHEILRILSLTKSQERKMCMGDQNIRRDQAQEE
jgi:hypothetical protein